jgi:hypothetical protein
MFSLSSIAANNLRSSAISMLWGEVPMMLTPFFCRPGEVERRLAAELRDGAPAFLAFVNMQDVFQRERLKKQFVAGVVIRGDGLGIGIDHDGLETVLLQREGGVDAAVIEFNALADAVGAAAEDHDFFGLVVFDFVVAAVVGGIIIRRVGLKLGGAGVHEAVAGDDASFLRRARTASSVWPVKWAICRSENPSDLALANSSRLSDGIGAIVSRCWARKAW